MKFICECGKEFDNIQSYRTHRYRCSTGKIYYKQELNYLENLKNKIYQINEDNIYECSCGKKFQHKSHYIKHIKECEQSKEIYNLYQQYQLLLNQKKISNQEYICNTCGKSFTTLAGLSFHCTKQNHQHLYKTKREINYQHKNIFFQKICQVCNRKFKNWEELQNHYEQEYNYKFINNFDFRVKYKNYLQYNLDIPKCQYCNQNDIICKSNRVTCYCLNNECKHKYLKEIQKNIHDKNPQLRINARLRRIEFLSNKDNFNKTAWSNKAKHQKSFLEQWFINNIINTYHLQDKYNIKSEYPIVNEDKTSAYCLDFAFIDIKLDVELDGRCHFIHGNKRIEHDIKRDNFLKTINWTTYRISYKDVEEKSEETIKKFIDYLNSLKFETILNT